MEVYDKLSPPPLSLGQGVRSRILQKIFFKSPPPASVMRRTKLKPNCIDTLTFFRVVPENVLTGLGVDRCRSRRRAVRSAPQHRTCPVRSSLLLSCVRPLVSADAAFEAARIFKL